MAIKRKETRNITVLYPACNDKSKWDVQCRHRENGTSAVGVHYAVLPNGDVEKFRARNECGHAVPLYNKDSVFIEVPHPKNRTMTEAQETSLNGLISYLEEQYPDAEQLHIL